MDVTTEADVEEDDWPSKSIVIGNRKINQKEIFISIYISFISWRGHDTVEDK